MKNSRLKNIHIYNKVKSMAGIAMLLLCSCDAENTISTQYLCQLSSEPYIILTAVLLLH